MKKMKEKLKDKVEDILTYEESLDREEDTEIGLRELGATLLLGVLFGGIYLSKRPEYTQQIKEYIQSIF